MCLAHGRDAHSHPCCIVAHANPELAMSSTPVRLRSEIFFVEMPEIGGQRADPIANRPNQHLAIRDAMISARP